MNFDNVKNVPCVGAKEVVPDKVLLPDGTPDPDVIVTPDETVSRKCIPGEDMEYAALAGESYCTNAPAFGDLVIERPTAEVVELVGTAEFRAYLYFRYKDTSLTAANTPGKSYRIDVTDRAKWSSSDTGIAVHDKAGKFKGKSVSADKTVKINASYTPSAVIDGTKVTHSEAIIAQPATLTVKDSCLDTAIDIVLVVDRSGSMLKTDEPNGSAGLTRLEAAKAACLQLVDSSKCYSEDDVTHVQGDPNNAVNTGRTLVDGKLREVDRIAIVTYAGEEGPSGSAMVHSGFDSTKEGVKTSVGEIRVAHECGGEETPSRLLSPDPEHLPEDAPEQPTGCWTGMGAALRLAYDLLQENLTNEEGDPLPGTRGEIDKDWPRKLIVLLTDGYENVCDPDPEQVAGEIKDDRKGEDGATKAHDTMVYAIGFMVDQTQAIRRCPGSGGSTITAASYLGTLANCYANAATSLTAFPQSAAELSGVYTTLLNLICEDNLKANTVGNTACHYIDTSGMTRASGPVGKNLSIGYAWEQWANWVVCKNTVDKMGVKTFNDINPSEGTMVGLIGNQGLRLLRGSVNDPDFQSVVKSDYTDDWEEDSYCQAYYAPYDHNFGGIELRQNKKVTFTSGKAYKLTLRMGGNQISGKGNFTHGVSVGSSVRISIGGTQQGIDEGSRAMLIPNKSPNDSLERAKSGKQVGLPMLVTRNLIAPLKVGSSSKYIATRADNGAVFIVEIDPESKIQDYVFEFTPTETADCVIRIEQYPHNYQKAVAGFKHNLTDKDVSSMLDDAERYLNEKPKCKITKELDITWFSGFHGSTNNVVYDSNEGERYETSGADEFLAPVPFGVVLSNATLTEDGVAVTSFCDNGTETFSD